MFFNKKRCPACGEEIKAGWNFCPHCGERLLKREAAIPFEDLFGDIEKEFEKIDRAFSSEFFKFPKFRFEPIRRGGGISITIRSGFDKEPKVDVRTFGEYKKFEPEIKRKLGVRAPIEEVEEVEKPRRPKVTEEPETKVERVNGRSLITVKLPGVKSEKDIEIRRLEQSLEIRAFAKDKAYFTLLPIKAGMEISRKIFEDGILKIEMK